MDNLTLELTNEKATEHLAKTLAACSQIGDVIFLKGTLGMGKSSFARAFIRSLSRNKNLDVPSPTFTLVQTYLDIKIPVWHFDLYRLNSPHEIEEIGMDEALSSAISLIEWPERLGPLSFSNRLIITLEPGKTSEARRVHLCPDSAWEERLKGLNL